MTVEHPASDAGGDTTQPRRGFLTQLLALALSGLVAVLPFTAGLIVFFDPLRARKRGDAASDGDAFKGYKVARLDALPDDGTPQYVKVIADRWDAWNYIPDEPVGAVYLRKTEEGNVVAFNVACPHAGCAVEFAALSRDFRCPCHSSSFTISGQRSSSSPSARDLDELPTEIRDGEVWVQYQSFRTGTAERIPVT